MGREGREPGHACPSRGVSGGKRSAKFACREGGNLAFGEHVPLYSFVVCLSVNGRFVSCCCKDEIVERAWKVGAKNRVQCRGIPRGSGNWRHVTGAVFLHVTSQLDVVFGLFRAECCNADSFLSYNSHVARKGCNFLRVTRHCTGIDI